MKTMRWVLVCGAVAGTFMGCAHNQRQAAVPPATTQEACAQVRDFFAKHDAPLSSPIDMSAGCHFHVTTPSNLSRSLGKKLETSGWKKEDSSKVAWGTPATRCTVEATEVRDTGSPVHGSIGVSGGTHIGTGFGIGIGVGSPVESTYDYKIDCLPTGR
jgi:hypothetical protein